MFPILLRFPAPELYQAVIIKQPEKTQQGYKATIVGGVVVRRDDRDTGERPGRGAR